MVKAVKPPTMGFTRNLQSAIESSIWKPLPAMSPDGGRGVALGKGFLREDDQQKMVSGSPYNSLLI